MVENVLRKVVNDAVAEILGDVEQGEDGGAGTKPWGLLFSYIPEVHGDAPLQPCPMGFRTVAATNFLDLLLPPIKPLHIN